MSAEEGDDGLEAHRETRADPWVRSILTLGGRLHREGVGDEDE